MTSRIDIRLRLIERLSELTPQAWDALAEEQICLSHAYLDTLEQTGSVGPGTGWRPLHLTLWHHDTLVGALPLYEKHHSFGEYVFDWAWADAYQRHGLSYYPKWLGAIPFTPVPGPRLLARDEHCRALLIDAALKLAKESGFSSLHVLLPDTREQNQLHSAGFMIRHGVQFHWHNKGFASFDDFVARLNHKKRKHIRQERRRAAQSEVQFRWLSGRDATESDWAFFYHCYSNTYARHYSTPYLNQAFFTQLARRKPDGVRLLLALRDERPVASAFFLCDEHALYGRYWGATEHIPFLHFELCYYRAIEYCIDHHIARFEGGAQGEHKLSRGLEPTPTCSAHWLRDSRFSDAVDRYLEHERRGIGFYLDELSERSPFRRNTPDEDK